MPSMSIITKLFSPEIINALKIVDKSEVAAKLVCQHAEIGGNAGTALEFNEQRLQMNLYYICQKFYECLGTLKLNKNIILFIDGIDVRPSQIPYEEYLDCIKGLANACWTLNAELFSNVRDSKGQIRIVLLLRPDIFNSLNMQNLTNKLARQFSFLLNGELHTQIIHLPIFTRWQTSFCNTTRMSSWIPIYGTATSIGSLHLQIRLSENMIQLLWNS